MLAFRCQPRFARWISCCWGLVPDSRGAMKRGNWRRMAKLRRRVAALDHTVGKLQMANYRLVGRDRWQTTDLGRSLMDIKQHACLQCSAVLSRTRREIGEPAGYCDTCWHSRCDACGYWQELMTRHGELWLCPQCSELTPLGRHVLAAMNQILKHYPFRIWERGRREDSRAQRHD